MPLFFRLFDTGIPRLIAESTILVAFVATCIVVWQHKESKRKWILMVWIVACLFLMLYTTVLGRPSLDSYNIRLMPFWSIGAMQSGLIEVLYEKIYNILFFIPLGFLIALYFKRRTFKNSLMLGTTSSISIELLQLITRIGTCESDDVICNTLGCAIGSMLAVGLVKVYGRFKK